jgi:DNA-binding LytR/AlgR family response regulator
VRPRAVIAEDEALLREQLAEFLASCWPELEIVALAEDGLQAMQALEMLRPDVLFLDIQMPELSGLEVARRASGKSHVVFVTAYDQYAVAAFEHGAVDYVMKPLTPARIGAAVHRLRERMLSAPANLRSLLDELARAPRRQGVYLRWINAGRANNDVVLITAEEVRYFQSDTKYTRVVTAHRDGLIRKTIKELVDELDPEMFWQIHRATIVNLNAIEAVGRGLKGNVILRLKGRRETLAVSQPFAHLFRQM